MDDVNEAQRLLFDNFEGLNLTVLGVVKVHRKKIASRMYVFNSHWYSSSRCFNPHKFQMEHTCKLCSKCLK